MKRIYIDFDSLFDTRLGLIHQHMGKEVSKELVNNERYFLRDYDDWSFLTGGVVTNEMFEQWWNDRDASVLPCSMMTSILFPVRAILDTVRSNVEEGVDTRDLSFLVNTWPYNVGQEVEKAITQAIVHHLGFAIPIVYTSVSPEELTPAYLVEHVHFVYMYDYHRWVTLHSFRIRALVQTGLTLTVPRRFVKDPSEMTVEKKKECLFYFEMATRIHMDFVFLEVEYFSMFRPQILDRIHDMDRVDMDDDEEHTPPPK